MGQVALRRFAIKNAVKWFFFFEAHSGALRMELLVALEIVNSGRIKSETTIQSKCLNPFTI